MGTKGESVPHPHTLQGFHLSDRDTWTLALLLRNMPRLVTLHLAKLQLDSGALFSTLAAGAQASVLHELSVDHCAMNHAALVQCVSVLQHLRALNLFGGMGIVQTDVSPLAQLPKLERLEVIMENKLTRLDAVLSSCHKLRELSLYHLAVLSPSSRSPSLEELTILFCALGDELASFDLVHMFPRLQAVRARGLGIAPSRFEEALDIQVVSRSASWLARCQVPFSFHCSTVRFIHCAVGAEQESALLSAFLP